MNKIGIIFAILAMVFGFGTLSTQAASAATNGDHNQHFFCDSGGTTIDVTLYYNVSGVGSSQINFVDLMGVSWTTSPAAQLDRISVFGLNDALSGGDDVQLYAYGGTSSSQNDVPSSHISDQLGRGYFFADNTPGDLSVNVWGGVGNSNAYCQTNHHVA